MTANVYTPERVTFLAENEVFVFGSNEAGRHGAGAALFARKNFQAGDGVGEGRTGWCYALPTKDRRLNVRQLQAIEVSVDRFVRYAMAHPLLRFLVTPVGCGLAGYTPEDIAPLFADVPGNVILPLPFLKVLYA